MVPIVMCKKADKGRGGASKVGCVPYHVCHVWTRVEHGGGWKTCCTTTTRAMEEGISRTTLLGRQRRQWWVTTWTPSWLRPFCPSETGTWRCMEANATIDNQQEPRHEEHYDDRLKLLPAWNPRFHGWPLFGTSSSSSMRNHIQLEFIMGRRVLTDFLRTTPTLVHRRTQQSTLLVLMKY
jgi:hypothetical protein